MKNVSPDDFTITLPLGKCNEYSIDLIQHFLDNFDNKIIIIYREKDPKDYILNPRIKYIKNVVKKHYSKFVNQCIKETHNGFERLVQEKNYKDKNIYKNLYPERSYLKFKDSIIEDSFTITRCRLQNSGISMDNSIDRMTDEERKGIAEVINFEYD